MRSTSRALSSRRRTGEPGSVHRNAVTAHGDIVVILRRPLLSNAVERSWPIGLCALIAYIAAASPHIIDGDSAELATLGALGGRAHPSGYPLYVLWLRLWSWLPGATAAHTAALATAILGALTIAALHAACRAWGVRPLATTVSVAIVGAAPVVLRYACEAEVFALNNLVAALVVWLAGANGPLRGHWRGAALGLVAGAGLANHLTCVLVAPLGVLGVVRAVRESRAARDARIITYALPLAGLAVGVLPYAYLAIADGPASWGTVSTPSDLIAILLRRDYGGADSFLFNGAAVPLATRIAACLATIGRSWLWLPAIAGAAMLAVRIRRPAGESRWAWSLLAASVVLAGPVLASQFNIDPHGLGLYVCERFHLLPTLLLAVPIAAALDLACARLPHPTAATALALLGFAALSIAGLPRLARTHSPAMERGVQNLLRSLPGGAIAVVIADDHCAGGRYLQLVRGERPDVALVCAGLLPLPWYRAAWAARGLTMPSSSGSRLGEALLATGRPVFVDPFLGGVLAAFPSYPSGILRRVLPHTAAPPPATDVAALNRDRFHGFDLDYPRPGRDDGYATLAHQRYAGTWAAIARALDATGDHDGARDARDVARQLLPAQDE
jgi:hypothetical protein